MSGRVRRHTWRAIGTGCELVTVGMDADTAHTLAQQAEDFVAELDATCSRFRADSELSRLRHGTEVPASSMLVDAVAAALETARFTGGLVDPTVGAALVAVGYDDDLDVVRTRTDTRIATTTPRPAPGFWRVQVDREARTLLMPHGVLVDLGSSAKAWAVDRLTERLGQSLPADAGLLVNLGGDLAVVGRPPAGGWRVEVEDGVRPIVAVDTGALATSSTVRRTWRHDGRTQHHILDPSTGRPVEPVWRTVTVAARTCEIANAASTAAVVLGAEAPAWLTARGLTARLVAADGTVTRTAGFPADPTGPLHSPDPIGVAA